jgi:hypothetical protein
MSTPLLACAPEGALRRLARARLRALECLRNLLLASLCCTPVLAPAPADACTLLLKPSAALVVFVTEIPAGGDIAIDCGFDCFTGNTAINISEGGDKLEGTIIRKGTTEDGSDWFVFRPDVAIREGQEFSVEVDSESGVHIAAVQVVPAVTMDPSEFDVAARIHESFEAGSEQICCDNSGLCNFDGSCFGTRQLVVPAFELSVTSSSAAHSQWIYRVTLETDGASSEISQPFLSMSRLRRAYKRTVSRLCYTVEAESFDGNTTAQVAHECLDSDVVYEERDLPEFDIDLGYRSCQAPPADHEGEWCAAHSICMEKDAEDQSENYLPFGCGFARRTCGWASAEDVEQEDADQEGDLLGDAGASTTHQGDGSLCSAAPWGPRRGGYWPCFALLIALYCLLGSLSHQRDRLGTARRG